MTENPVAEEPKNCLECGEKLGQGRRDRKFFNDICRTAWNNRRRSEPDTQRERRPEDWREEYDDRQLQKIIDILFTNRLKLMNMTIASDFNIALSDFYAFGLNLKYFTSEHKCDLRGIVFKMCFDYGYHIEGDRVYLIYYANELYFL